MRGVMMVLLLLLAGGLGGALPGACDGPGNRAAATDGATVATNYAGTATNYGKERAERARALTRPYGWFSLIALEWIKPGVTTVGSAKGNSVVLAGAPAHLVTFEERDGTVTLRAVSPGLTVGGRSATAGTPVGEDERDEAAMASGSLRIWAIDRGGKRYLRVKDSNAPALKGFHGLRWYAPEPKYRVEARWIPYPGPHTMNVMNKLGQVTPVPVPGYVEFELDGKRQHLTPMTATDDGLWFVFLDATHRSTTDGGGRFLTAAVPSNGLGKAGTVLLDFNEAENPPCAYSPYATCPLAAPENRLEVAVAAGEKRYE